MSEGARICQSSQRHETDESETNTDGNYPVDAELPLRLDYNPNHNLEYKNVSVFLAVQDSSITDIVCPLVGAN